MKTTIDSIKRKFHSVSRCNSRSKEVMSFFLLLLFLITSLSFSVPHLHVINVTEENELEQFLCYNDPPVVGDTLVVLYTNITHYISGNVSFCMINTAYSLNITSNSSGPAIINCNKTLNDRHATTVTGFSFINVPNLTLQRLVFRGCGGFLKNSTIIDTVNSTAYPFYFTQYQSAVLLLPHINILSIENVTITSYYGFAILAINPLNAIMNGLTISVSIIATPLHLGSGIVVYFIDKNICCNIDLSHTVVVKNSLIANNSADVVENKILKNAQIIQNKIPILTAASLTTLYTQTQYPANVSIIKTTFWNNFGTTTLFLHYKTNYSKTVFDQVNFVCNTATMGSSMALLIMNGVSNTSSPLQFNGGVFNNTSMLGLNLIRSNVISIYLYNPSIGSEVIIYFNNSVFTNNFARTASSCIYAIDTGVQGEVLSIYINDVTAHNNFKTRNFGNTRAELIKVDNAKELHISGFNNFFCNFGTIFDVRNTIIYLNGWLNISDNNGYMGTGFKVQGLSYFLLSNGLNATFINNTALTIGGAIYAIADEDFHKCMFQNSTENITNIKMTFINNTAAEAGSSFYSNNLYDCKPDSGKLNLINKSSTFSLSKHRNISIPPTSLCWCHSISKMKCNNALESLKEFNLNVKIRPGQDITLQLAAMYINYYLHKIYRSSYAAVTFLLRDEDNIHFVPSWQVSANSAHQALLEKQGCTSVTITLLKIKNETNPSSPAIIVSSSFVSTELILYGIQLLDCPIGFELNVGESKCGCSKVLHKIYSNNNPSYQPDCHINSGADNSISTITRTDTEWIGIANLSNGTVVFGAALNCFVYCRYKSGYTKLIVNDTNVAIADYDDLSNSVPLCIDNREGLLCSQCPPRYSAVFGSYECKQCSNWWLFTLIIYAVIGPLLIYLLYVLKLTLNTGSLNGIIFCIQILGFIDPPSIEMNLLLKSLIHFYSQYPVCLYHGMTELWKQGLLMMYQVYIFSILLGIIVLSRFSVKISNKIANSSVQILVTVVHVSFSYLLTSIMDVFTPVTIYTNNTEKPMQVWFKHPTVEYGTHGHLVIMIITSLVVGPILGVYMTVLLAGRPLMRINYRIREYIRPVYEAIHAPYKRNKEFFFVSRLLIVILLYVIYTCFRGKDMLLGIAIASPILSVYIAVESISRPFNRMSLNIFNLFLLSFSALIYGSSSYFTKSDREDGLIIIIAFSNAVVFISCIGVIIIHILWVTGLLEKIKIKFRKYWSHCLPRQNQEEAARVDMSGSFFEPYDRVREPLLSSACVQYH